MDGYNVTCAHCGEAFEPATLRGRPRFCSEPCRRAGWNEARRSGPARGPRALRPEGQRPPAPRPEGLIRTRKGKRKGRRPVATLARAGEPPLHLYFD